MIVSTEAIVIKSFDYRETSRIATFYTKEQGKISGILKGIRKSPKKFGSNIDKFSINHMVYYRYNRSDLHLVSQCDLIQYFFPIRQHYKRTIAANYALELIDLIMQVDQKNVKIYSLVMNYLNALEDVNDIDKLVHIFQVKILLLSGFRPHIDSCVKCRKKVQGAGKVRFSLHSGGLICAKCPTSERNFTVISKGTIASMLHIEQNNQNPASLFYKNGGVICIDIYLNIYII